MATTTTRDPKQPPKPNVICIDSGRLRFADKQRESARGAKRRDQWTGWRTHALALATQSCSMCYGLGHRSARDGASAVCYCVFRQIFRLCLAKFHQCLDGYAAIGKIDLTSSMNHGRNARATKAYSLRNEEFMADFYLVAFRALNGGKTKERLAEEGLGPSIYWQLFALHMLLGAQWQACCRKLGMDRGAFFHATYRIQAVLGLAFADTEPHALFPLDEYFSPVTKKRPASCEPEKLHCA